MKGSEKQIKWAEDIKSYFQEAIDLCIANTKKAGPKYNNILNILEGLDANEDASFWIKNFRNGVFVEARFTTLGSKAGIINDYVAKEIKK